MKKNKEVDNKEKSRKDFKKILLIIVLVIAIISVVFIVCVKIFYKDSGVDSLDEEIPNPEEGVYNTRAEVIETKDVDGIVFSNIDCYYDGSNTVISYTVTNTLDENVNVGWYNIIAYDDTMTVIKTLRLYLDYELEPMEEYEEVISTATDLSNAYTLEIVLDE